VILSFKSIKDHDRQGTGVNMMRGHEQKKSGNEKIHMTSPLGTLSDRLRCRNARALIQFA